MKIFKSFEFRYFRINSKNPDFKYLLNLKKNLLNLNLEKKKPKF